MTAIRTPDDEVTKPGWFYPPFKDGWTYHGATYAGHSDFSVDWNRRTPGGAWMDDTGDPVLAVADGTVAEVDKADGLVMVNHAGGYRTEYRHMTDIPVRVGQKVQRSDRLGSIGNVAGSGASFGSHLHHVHWKREPGKPWRRIKMAFEGQPIRTSVGDSDTRPDGWTPPAPAVIVGPPPRATWEGAFRDASKALARAEARLASQAALTALATDERDQARRDLATATARIVALEADLEACRDAVPPDCGPEVDRALTAEKRIADAIAVLTR